MAEGELSYAEGMRLNRHQRRALAKFNKLEHKIPGSTMPIINKARQQKKAWKREQDRLNGNA